jgi:succinate dehydrogenase / fumarate reductase cytochrome b subunit
MPHPLSLTTVVGRKNIEAVSGVLLLLFLVEHLLSNAMLVLPSSTPYLAYADFLGRLWLVRVMEVLLAALFVVHIGVGARMRYSAWRMRRKRPGIPPPKSITTRFVGLTGAVILLFLLLHLARFVLPHRMGTATADLYLDAHLAFSSLPYTLFYSVSMLALGMHLYHGIGSAVVSFSSLPRHRLPLLRRTARWTAVTVSAGLAGIACVLYVKSLL